MKRTLFAPNHFSLFGIAAGLWFLIFNQGLLTAYDVWITSDIYNHCLLILPIVAYLIHEQWRRVIGKPVRSLPILLVPISGLAAIQVFAELGDIKILMHFASFTALPIIIWALLGNQVARVIAFPLFFILFAIPIGDQLIPYLQEITTDIAVPMLQLTGIPVYRNGLYLDIPEGRFLVAEACSGISFLITTIAFGFLYAHLFFHQRKKQILFIVISLTLPVAANAIRVYGIILVAHLTDMEHAVGADHLIYGGVFYAIILVLLVLVGELFREKNKKSTQHEPDFSYSNNEGSLLSNKITMLGILVISVLHVAWLYSVNTLPSVKPQTSPQSELVPVEVKPIVYWQPKYDHRLSTRSGSLKLNNETSAFYIAYDDGQNGKLISSVHRLYDQKQWSLVSHNSANINDKLVTTYKIVSPTGNKLTLVRWYNIGGKHFASESKAKLYQAWLKATGTQAYGSVYILAMPNHKKDTELATLQLDVIENSLMNSFNI